MKKLLYILLLIMAVATRSQAQVSNCCPEFTLQQAGNTMACPGDTSCKDTPPHDPNGGNPGGGSNMPSIIACKNSVQSYYVFPNLPGFTFTWSVVGGTPATTTGNPAIITWGSGSSGILQVIISDASGSCRDTIRRKICLLNAPIADFSIAPNDTICVSQSISFTNNSLGATTYSWDFGDGTGANVANPGPHTYSSPGTYYVVLTVGNGGGGGSAGNNERCGCFDSDTIKVVVLAGTGPVITSPNCKKMLCPGDTATYCVSPGCAPYVWTVNGGTIVSGAGTSCIKVQWSSTTPPLSQFPTSVSVTTGCAGSCSNSATLNVPVLFNNIPITGPSPVCVGTMATYSLPVMPGTFYHWTVSGGGGGTIVAADSNTAQVTILWNGPPGNAVITCNYNNPYSGCHGSTSMPVNVRKKFTIAGPSPLCVNNGGFYSVTGGGTANWIITPSTGYTPPGSPPGIFNSAPGISLTWNTAGTYNIAAGPTPATANQYCNDSAFLSVLVNPRPVLSAIVGANSICPGNYYTYSVTSNMVGSFVWNVSNGTIISQMGTNNDSILVQFNTAASHTVTVMQTVNGCSSSISLPVTNVPTPTISPNVTVCRDQQVTYTATGSLPVGSYTWSISPAAAGTILTGQGSNTVTILWHGTATPGTSTATISLVVCNYPAITQNVTITTPAAGTITQSGTLCPSGITLTVSGFTCSQYQWLLNGVPYDTTATPSTLATLPGSYAVRCLTGCGGYATTFIPNQPLPNASISANGPTAYCTGATINLQLAALNTPGYSYQWYNSSGPLAGQINNTTTVTGPGSYYVIITWGNCTDTSNVINVIVQNCDPACNNYVYIKSFNEKSEILAGPAPAPVSEERVFNPTLNINFPTTNCNSATFSGTYSVSTPFTFNSGIHWDFGDGSGIATSANAATITHNYTTPGYYFVTAWITVICPPDGRICKYLDTATVYVPLAANFQPQVNCNTVLMNNQSQNLPGCTPTSSWTVLSGPSGWSFSPSATAFNPTMNVTQSGTYTIQYTMFSAACNCTVTTTQTVTVTLPSAAFTVAQTVCAGAPITLTATTPGMANYLWNFGDNYTSNLNPTTQHAWAISPANPIISLTVTDANGCTATVTDTITVVPPPALTITPDQYICRGGTATITATGAGFTTYTFYHNGNQVQTGPSNTYSTTQMGTYWVVGNNSTSSCPVTSAQTHVFYHPQPVANIQGSGVACLSGGVAYINLSNSVNDPNWTYNWTQVGSPTVFPNQSYLSTTVNATGNYSFILTVTNQQGCVARDTFCVVVGEAPTVTVTGGSGTLCAGTLHTFTATATPANPNYIYQWSNGATGSTMSTSLPGMYTVNVLNPANGCSGFGFAGVIQPRPSTILFPIGCDTLCDTDSVIPPLALATGQNYSMYTIQWFLNGNYATPIHTGPSLNLGVTMPPLVYGMNNISIVVTLNGCSDTSNTYNLFIKKCSDCDCEKSSWGDIVLTQGDVTQPQPTDPKLKAAIITPGGKKLICKETYTLECFKPITITGSYNCADTANCPPKVTYSLQPPTGLPLTGTLALNYTPTISGTYTLTLYGWCGDKICDSCVIYFKVTCPPTDCNCRGSKWDAITISPAPIDATSTTPADAKPAIGIGTSPLPVSVKLNCNKSYNLKCNQPYTINAGYICPAANCPGHVEATLTGPLGTTTGPVPFTFTPTVTGTYTLTLYGYCGTVKCDSCVIKFNVKCDPIPPPPCCPYEIGVKDPTVTLSTLANPPATIANAIFGITGPAGNLFTEIRAEVVSYNLFSNFNNECLSCKSYPYSWSSMYQPGNIGTMPPKITMYGGATVPAFNPSGAGMYQNPREVIWNNGGTAFSLPSNINLSFLLPPSSIIDCCELTAKICVKFTFRDKDCKECEVIVCFTVVIKPGGGEPPHADCKCSIKPVLTYEGGSKTVGCGETINLFLGNIPVSLAPNFTCKDANGKDCPSTGPTVAIRKPDNSVQMLTGPAFNYTFLTPGNYEYTVSGICNGQKCECKFKVQIPTGKPSARRSN